MLPLKHSEKGDTGSSSPSSSSGVGFLEKDRIQSSLHRRRKRARLARDGCMISAVESEQERLSSSMGSWVLPCCCQWHMPVGRYLIVVVLFVFLFPFLFPFLFLLFFILDFKFYFSFFP